MSCYYSITYINGRNWEALFSLFEAIPLNLIYLTQFYINRPLVPPLWYMSATLLALPLVILAIQSRASKLIKMLNIYLLFLYMEGFIGNYEYMKQWSDILRAFIFLMLGTLLYDISGCIATRFNRKEGLSFTFIEIFSGLLLLYFLIFNSFIQYRSIVILICILSVVTFSELSYTKYIKGRLFEHLGQRSMYIFIIHWPVGIIVSNFPFANNVRLLVYFVMLSVAVWFMVFIEYFRKKICRFLLQ